ncbi:hypothetical protein [Prevotella sp.]|uniref:hypothetical protein n=1 Tax=Prevotella sp. TaxID=59823 RepID=UPI002F94D9D4
MTYDSEIIKVLAEAGDKGLSVKKIAQHVFNASNSLFNMIVYEDVYAYVAQFLAQNAKSQSSLIVRGEARGIYKLNTKIDEGQQLMIKFGRHEEEDFITPPIEEENELFLF